MTVPVGRDLCHRGPVGRDPCQCGPAGRDPCHHGPVGRDLCHRGPVGRDPESSVKNMETNGDTEYRHFNVKSVTHMVLYLVSNSKYVLAKLKCKHLTLKSFILHLTGRNCFHVIANSTKEDLECF